MIEGTALLVVIRKLTGYDTRYYKYKEEIYFYDVDRLERDTFVFYYFSRG